MKKLLQITVTICVLILVIFFANLYFTTTNQSYRNKKKTDTWNSRLNEYKEQKKKEIINDSIFQTQDSITK